jgi:plastocyanin
MKHLALLASIYAVIVALALPGSLLAQEEAAPPAETTAAEPAPVEQTPAEPAPAPAPPEPAPAEPAPAPPPEPQFLADERAEKKDPAPQAVAAANGSVAIADFSFAPATITISQGDTVTWTNNGPTPHSATGGSFDTGIFPAGQSRSHTFNEAGTFSYICTPHPQMKGTVVVQASQSGDTPDSSGTGDTGAGTGDSGAAGAEAAQADGGPALPNSGADAGALLVLGALMLLLGVAMDRRARADRPQPAGRIGW